MGRATVRQERVSEPRLILQLRHLIGPLPGDGRRNEKALAAVFDRVLEELLERQLAELGVQLDPGRDPSWHGDGAPPARGHRVLAREVVERPGGWRAPRGVQSMQLLAVPYEGVGVRADAVG